jgi:hypothetical protein
VARRPVKVERTRTPAGALPDGAVSGHDAADPAVAGALADEPIDARLTASAVATWVCCAIGLGFPPATALIAAVLLVLAGLAFRRRVDRASWLLSSQRVPDCSSPG